MPRLFPSSESIGQECEFRTGYAVIAGGSGAISSSAVSGGSIAKTATGIYTITLDDTWNELCGVMVSMVEGTPSAKHCHIISESVISAKTIVLKFSLDATPGTGANPNDGTLHFTLSLRGDIRQTLPA